MGTGRTKEKNRVYQAEWRAKNPERAAAYRKEYAAANKDRINANNRKCRKANTHQVYLNNINAKYGLSAVEYHARLEKQEGRCALCADYPAPGKKLVVDHNHATEAVRDLICNKCNWMIGVIETNQHDFPLYLQYLEKHGAIQTAN